MVGLTAFLVSDSALSGPISRVILSENRFCITCSSVRQNLNDIELYVVSRTLIANLLTRVAGIPSPLSQLDNRISANDHLFPRSLGNGACTTNLYAVTQSAESNRSDKFQSLKYCEQSRSIHPNTGPGVNGVWSLLCSALTPRLSRI